MNKLFIALGTAVATLVIAGCASTEIIDPSRDVTNIKSEETVGSEEMRIVAREAIRAAMTNVKFKTFLRRYKREMKDNDAIPILKLDRVVNDTDDPDLNVDELTDMLNEALLNAGIVDVTMAEGAGLSTAIANSREIENDDNFDQKTVAQRGTLQAARIVLRPKIISNVVNDGRRKVVARTFVMDMGDIRTGLTMWKYTKQLGFVKKRGIVGW